MVTFLPLLSKPFWEPGAEDRQYKHPTKRMGSITSMQVQPNFETMCLGPLQSPFQVKQTSGNKWFLWLRMDGPVSNRNPHMSQSSISDLTEIILGNERLPMISEHLEASGLAILLTEGPFINRRFRREDFGSSIVNRRRNPRFREQPSTKIDTSHLWFRHWWRVMLRKGESRQKERGEEEGGGELGEDHCDG